MLLKLGIQCKLKEHRTSKGLMHKLVVRGNEGRIKFLDIGATTKHKIERLQEIKKVVRFKEHENIPHPSSLIREIKKLPYKTYRNKDYYVYESGNATKHSLNVLYNLAKENNLINDQIQKEFDLLMRRDIGWEKIEEIEDIGRRELFDFTVNKDSFVGAPYFFLHNSKFYGESEKKIRDIFNEAEKNAPSIIFIDEIDAIAPKREESYGEVERRIVSQMLTMMDGLKNRGKVIVIGATNRPDAIDPALRRGGRFDREIQIGVPRKEGRLKILQIHTRNMPLAKDVNLRKYVEFTHGFVGADLSALCKEAAMSRVRKVLPDLKLGKEDDPISQEILDSMYITNDDFKEALKVVQPSAMREVYVESPNVKWSDIGGMESVKVELKEAVEMPLKHPEAFKRLGIRPPKGVLLYGPPGTGKTLFAKAVASESAANFIQIKGPELLSKWVGESEKGVRKIFNKARQVAPCVVFFDEIDSLTSKRGYDHSSKVTESVLNQILAEMDGLLQLEGVVVIGATNRPDMIDPALLRPGRFDRMVMTDVPTKEGREEIFKIHTRNMPLAKDVKINDLAEKTEGLVGADIESICREAAMLALRENIKSKEVKKKHFEEAIKKIKPSVSSEDFKQYKAMEMSMKKSRISPVHSPNYMG